MITIAEVIEQCAKLADEFHPPGKISAGHAIRALAAQYEGCIVAEELPNAWMSPNMEILSPVRSDTVFGSHTIPLYRARKPETCKPALQVEEVEPVAHRHKWFRTGAMEPGQMRCIECGEWSRETAPPARRPLTDEEIKLIVNKSVEGVTVSESVTFRAVARAIERAHKIGGNDD